MNKIVRLVFLVLAGAFMFQLVTAQNVNELTKKEKKEGWVLLFNGDDFDGWRQYNGDKMPDTWKIDDQAMKVSPKKQKGHGAGADIIYHQKMFKNFELSIDWKASKEGNSGIFYYVKEVPGKPVYYAAPEMQILDNEHASDNKIDSHLAGSLYDMIAADPETVKPYGQWNTAKIVVNKGRVTHFMNGKEVAAYTLWTDEWDEMVANSKFKNFPGFQDGIAKEGYIGLQDHGYDIWFRNIKIREIK
jgi:hypothetical protein